jgi:hypothetical protein
LDICAYNCFTLLIGSSQAWGEKSKALQERLKGSRIQLHTFALGRDFQIANEKHKALFLEQGGFAAGGGLLVRPDQHILSVISSTTSAKDLDDALRTHLGLGKL